MTTPDDLNDILMILSHPEEDPCPTKNISNTGRDLRLEGIHSILQAGSGLIELPKGHLRDLHRITQELLLKNGSATTNERVRIRCIGALGLVHRRYDKNTPPHLSDMCSWLFGIALSDTQDLSSVVSKRVGFVLQADKIIQTK